MKRVLLTGTILLAVNVNAALSADIDISNAWIREAPPVASVQAGYFTLCNRDKDVKVVLERIESDAFGRIEMHETLEADGISRMVKLESVMIPAGDCVSFEQGGRHLMLFEPVNRLNSGDIATLRLIIDDMVIEHEFPVSRGNSNTSEDHTHHHGH